MKRLLMLSSALLAIALTGCATDRSGLSLNDGKQLAEHKTEKVCSSVAPVGSHMKRVVCRSRAVIDETSERAQDALRAYSQRNVLCPKPTMCSGPQGN